MRSKQAASEYFWVVYIQIKWNEGAIGWQSKTFPRWNLYYKSSIKKKKLKKVLQNSLERNTTYFKVKPNSKQIQQNDHKKEEYMS